MTRAHAFALLRRSDALCDGAAASQVVYHEADEPFLVGARRWLPPVKLSQVGRSVSLGRFLVLAAGFIPRTDYKACICVPMAVLLLSD